MKLNNWLFFLTVLRLQCEELLQNPSFPNSALGVTRILLCSQKFYYQGFFKADARYMYLAHIKLFSFFSTHL